MADEQVEPAVQVRERVTERAIGLQVDRDDLVPTAELQRQR